MYTRFIGSETVMYSPRYAIAPGLCVKDGTLGMLLRTAYENRLENRLTTQTTSEAPWIRTIQVCRYYRRAQHEVRAVDEVTLSIPKGDCSFTRILRLGEFSSNRH